MGTLGSLNGFGAASGTSFGTLVNMPGRPDLGAIGAGASWQMSAAAGRAATIPATSTTATISSNRTS